jgi:hypothetical protein
MNKRTVVTFTMQDQSFQVVEQIETGSRSEVVIA